MKSRFKQIEKLKVSLNFGSSLYSVGTLAYLSKRSYFQYDVEFLQGNLNISPHHLRWTREPQQMVQPYFDDVFGVFYDSIPDGWGRLLVDRRLSRQGFNPQKLTALDRLAIVGSNGMGALVYKPEYRDDSSSPIEEIDLEKIAVEANEIQKGESSEYLDQLQILNGGSGGARPKALIGVSPDKNKLCDGQEALRVGYEPWLVKFANSTEGEDAGAIEYVYSLMAEEAGIEMSETHLFPSTNCQGFFGTRRFDRNGDQRLHMHTICGLLHSSYRVPALDYEDLLKVTFLLTKDYREAQKAYRLAVFNVLSCNQDDHSKNFAYLMNEEGEWKFSPAYDLTFFERPYSERSTTVFGKSKEISTDDLIRLGQVAQVKTQDAMEIIEMTKEALDKWGKLAVDYNVSKEMIRLIGNKISDQLK